MAQPHPDPPGIAGSCSPGSELPSRSAESRPTGISRVERYGWVGPSAGQRNTARFGWVERRLLRSPRGELAAVAYARFGPRCDIYVFLTGNPAYLACLRCPLPGPFEFEARSTVAMVAHIREHIAAGHAVPDDVIPRLLAEQEANDAEMRGESP